MKKFVYAFIIGCAFSGCSHDEPLQVYEATSGPQGSCLLSVENAISVANQAAEAFDAKLSRTSSRRASSAAMVDVLGAKNGRSGGIDTLLYIVNYDNRQGFAIISATYEAETLLGIVDEGEFNALEAAENPAFCYYLENAQNYVASTLGSGISIGGDPITPGFIEETRLVHEDYPAKVTVKWGQNYPEGHFCPNGMSGCVQTAMAQMMSYLKLPTSINLTYPERDTNVQALDWEAMTGHKQSLIPIFVNQEQNHLASCEASFESHMAIARLCRELGYRNSAVYNQNSTMATDTLALQTFRQLVPEKVISDFVNLGTDYTSLFDAIKTGIGFICGSDPITNTEHAWVIDGALRTGKVVTVSGPGTKGEDGIEHPYERDQTTYYYHFNWGRNGSSNGYFVMGVFDPSKVQTNVGGPNNVVNANRSRANYRADVKYFIIK